jgi:hypothetical protein
MLDLVFRLPLEFAHPSKARDYPNSLPTSGKVHRQKKDSTMTAYPLTRGPRCSLVITGCVARQKEEML